MQIKRPLCLFVLLFTILVFIMNLVIPRKSGERDNQLKVMENQTVCLTGCLKQKEVKNGNLIYYLEDLKEIQFLKFTKNQQKFPQSDLVKQKVCHTNTIRGAVCYIKNKELSNSPPVGSWLRIKGKVFPYSRPENEGQFDSDSYYYVMGYDFMLTGANVIELSREWDFTGEMLWKIRQNLRGFYEANMDIENASVLSAMLLGDKSNMSMEIKDLYRKSGIAHILAISGLHISLLGMSFYKLLRKLFIPQVICAVLGIVVVYLYGRMTGGGSSSFRAGCMFTIFLMAEVLDRSYDILTAMALSALILLISEPAYLNYAGFLLSFFAVLGLAIVNPGLQNAFRPVLQKCSFKPLNKILLNLISGLSIQLMTFPILLWFYYEFPMYSVFLNLIILPCMGVLLICAIAGGILKLPFLLYPSVIILKYYELVCNWMEKLPFHTIITGRPQLWQILIYYVLLLFLIVYYRKIRPRSFWLACMLIVMCISVMCIKKRDNCIDMLSVGQGDCTCIRNKQGNCIIMDGGSNDVKEAGKYRLIPYLKYHGISTIDVVTISHAHEDHNSAILELLTGCPQNGIKVRYLLISRLAIGKQEYRNILKEAERIGCKVCIWEKGDQITCGNIHLRCIFPESNTRPDDENDASLVIHMKIEDFDMLFTGDCTSVYEKDIIHTLSQYDLHDINCLKVGHHGAKTSTGNELLRYLQPQVALISCGQDNRYGHPHQETLNRLEKASIRYYVTSQTGQIELIIHKKGYKVKCYNK